jgi:hypothetical protein
MPAIMMTICSDRDDRDYNDYEGLVGNRNLLNVAKTNFSQLHGFRTINISAAIDAGGVIDTSAAANGLVMCRSDEDSSNDDDFIASRVGY